VRDRNTIRPLVGYRRFTLAWIMATRTTFCIFLNMLFQFDLRHHGRVTKRDGNNEGTSRPREIHYLNENPARPRSERTYCCWFPIDLSRFF
jgi:hypothetical protein